MIVTLSRNVKNWHQDKNDEKATTKLNAIVLKNQNNETTLFFFLKNGYSTNSITFHGFEYIVQFGSSSTSWWYVFMVV